MSWSTTYKNSETTTTTMNTIVVIWIVSCRDGQVTLEAS